MDHQKIIYFLENIGADYFINPPPFSQVGGV